MRSWSCHSLESTKPTKYNQLKLIDLSTREVFFDQYGSPSMKHIVGTQLLIDVNDVFRKLIETSL